MVVSDLGVVSLVVMLFVAVAVVAVVGGGGRGIGCVGVGGTYVSGGDVSCGRSDDSSFVVELVVFVRVFEVLEVRWKSVLWQS